MNVNTPPDRQASDFPEPVIRSRKRQFSIVWVVPVIAAAIGGWLIYKAVTEKGPDITITFRTAEGLEAGKTVIKCKDVEVGQVQEILLSPDLSQVIVKARLVKPAEKYISENSRFWVVRARVTASAVTGLGTVFSGAFIEVDPGLPGKSAKNFTGLEEPPLVTTGEVGRHFTLTAERKGSLSVGSPVYYRQLQVGRVTSFNLAQDGTGVVFKIFINSPNDNFVHTNTRFWNASGFDMKLDAQGVRIDTESVVTLLIGGVAFDVVESFEGPGEVAKEDAAFKLFPNRDASRERVYETKRHYLLHFGTSVRGLAPGAPVEFRGIPVGKVLDLKLEFEPKDMTFDIPVLIEIEPERITARGELAENGDEEKKVRLDRLVERGLRAQLRSGNVITGQQYVALDIFPDVPASRVSYDGPHPTIPTMPSQIEELGTKLTQLVAKLDKIPIEQIGNDLKDTIQGAKRLTTSPELAETIKSLNAAIKEIQLLTAQLRTKVAPEVSAAVAQAQKSLLSAETSLAADSPLQHRLISALEELSGAARALRTLADYVERHPESFLYGKGQPK